MNSDTLRAVPRVENHEDVVRYVGGANYDSGTGKFNGSAFERQPKDTDGLSVNRCGVFSSDKMIDQNHIRKVSASRLKLGASARFAQLNVGRVLEVLAEFEQDIFVCQNPLPAEGTAMENPAHALIVGLPFKGEAIGSLRSELVGDKLRNLIFDSFPAVVSECEKPQEDLKGSQ